MSDPAPAADPLKGVWAPRGSRLQVEYSLSVMDQVRAACGSSHAGIENGGILYGSYSDDVVSIQAWRPIACEHQQGRVLALSERDRAALAESLRAAKTDPVLARLAPVGCFVSHTRGDLTLTQDDRRLFDEFFPENYQVLLVVRPFRSGMTRAGFFTRAQDGRVDGATLQEFTIGAQETVAAVPSPTPPPPRHAPKPAPAVALSTPSLEPPPPPSRRWLGVGLTTFGLGALALAGVLAIRPSSPLFIPHQPLSLRIQDSEGGQLRIDWDKNAAAVRNASRAVVEVDDGGRKHTFDISPADLRIGTFTYQRQAGDVRVKLRIFGADDDPVEEFGRFLGNAPEYISPREARVTAERDRLAAELANLQEQLRKETLRNRALRRMLDDQ